MATSNSTDFNQERNELIEDSLRLIGVLGADQDVTNDTMTLCNRVLNRMVKAWQLEGLYTFNQEEAIIFLRNGVQKYQLGVAGDQASKIDTVVKTTLSAAEALGQTVLTITDTTGMSASDNIGIELDDNTRQWTTIVSVDSSTQVTVTASLTVAAASGSTVYSYTTLLNRPLKIINARREDKEGNESEIIQYSREEFFGIVDKTSTSVPAGYFYDPNIRDTGTLYVWPTSNKVYNKLRITYQRALEDFDSTNDNPDFPVEWYEAITYNLADRVAPLFSIKSRDISDIRARAFDSLEKIKYATTEMTPTYLVVDEEY